MSIFFLSVDFSFDRYFVALDNPSGHVVGINITEGERD